MKVVASIKNYNIYLIMGAFLSSLIFVLNYFFDEIKPAASRVERESHLDLIIILSLSIIIVPIIEELAFRLFIASIRIWVQFISFFLYIAFTINIFKIYESIFLITIMFLIVFSIHFKYLNKQKTIHLQIISSSVLFSLFHYGNINYETSTRLGVIIYHTYIFGLAFLLSGIKIKFNIFYAILLHVFINGFFILSQASGNHERIQKLNVEGFEVEVIETPFYKNNLSGSSGVINDTLIIRNMDFIVPLKINRPDKLEILKTYTQKNILLNYDMRIPNYKEIDIKVLLEKAEQKGYVVKKDNL